MGIIIAIMILSIVGLMSLIYGRDGWDVAVVPSIMFIVVIIICIVQIADAFGKIGIL